MGENPRPVHQAVNHQSMLRGIDVRDEGALFGRRHIVQRRCLDRANRILQRRGYVELQPKVVG